MRACEKCRYFVISITITREETRECVFYVCLYGTHCFSSKLNCICCINCRSNLVFILFFFYIINQNKTKQKTNQQQKHKQTREPMCLRCGQVSQNKDDDKKYIYSGQTNIYVNRFLLQHRPILKLKIVPLDWRLKDRERGSSCYLLPIFNLICLTYIQPSHTRALAHPLYIHIPWQCQWQWCGCFQAASWYIYLKQISGQEVL